MCPWRLRRRVLITDVTQYAVLRPCALTLFAMLLAPSVNAQSISGTTPLRQIELDLVPGVLPTTSALQEADDTLDSDPATEPDLEPSYPRSHSRRRIYFDLHLGAGEYEHETRSSTLDGDADGGYIRIRGEVSNGELGAGFALEAFGSSDDDLFDDIGAFGTDGNAGSLFFYGLIEPKLQRDVRLPIRIGPYLSLLSLEDDAVEINWVGIGGRIEIEPEWWFYRSDDIAFGLTGNLSAGAHISNVELDVLGSDEDFDGNGVTWGAGVGIRALFGDTAVLSVEYISRSVVEDETDDNGGFSLLDAEGSFNGVVIGLGFRF